MVTQIREITEGKSAFEKEYELLEEYIPAEDFERIMNQDGINKKYDFAGFVNLYSMARYFIKPDMTVINIGCYIAPQSFLFKDYEKYIGVDECELERFSTDNTEHYVGSVKDFLREYKFDDMSAEERSKYYVLIGYDMDIFTKQRIEHLFKNNTVFYPIAD